jgi:glycosyltransferase involved in cell wall biosynthesis
MKTLLQINSVINTGSTGRIAEEIGQKAIAAGWQSHIAYGRETNRTSQSHKIRIESDWDIRLHGVQTRLLDNHSLGLSSRSATKKLISRFEEINPDIIHLHNLHGYYLNIEVLFNYLATKDIPIVWTLHDCWSFTGHCAHFEAVGCNKWKAHCYKCPLTRSYPASLLIDRSKNNFTDKKRLFNSVNNLTIVPVSNWLHNHLNDSFLSEHTIKTIYNGIDLNIFTPDEIRADIKQKYNLNNKFVLLGVSSIWNKGKGLDDFIELSTMIDTDTIIILVGLQKNQIESLPDNIVGIEKTENQKELAELYSISDLFVNPTYGDTFPTTNLESLACGTPVVTYKTGGSPEAITNETGFIVAQGDLKGVLKAIEEVRQKGENHYTPLCRQRAEEYFNKDDRYQEYLELYEEILNKER